MAWNRPRENGEAASSPLRGKGGASAQKRRGRRFPIYIAALVVVLGAAVAAWWLWLDASAPVAENGDGTKKGLIKVVEPQLSAKEQEKLAHPGEVKIRGKWYPEYNKEGGKIWYTRDWVRYHSPKVRTNKVDLARQRIEYRIFSNPADREIAVLLNTAPDAFRIGNHEFGKDFEKQFLASLTEPIIPTKEDDENTAALKRAVNETKIDLKARYDAGEDIVKIMNDTLKEQRQLAAYRMELQQMVSQNAQALKKNDPKAVEDLYTAANQMLKERGQRPLRLPALLKRRLELEAQKSKKNEAK